MIIVRKTLTVPKLTVAGVALEISFARFMASNGRIQQGESVIPTFPSFGTFRIHGRRLWQLRGNGLAHRLCERIRALIEMRNCLLS